MSYGHPCCPNWRNYSQIQKIDTSRELQLKSLVVCVAQTCRQFDGAALIAYPGSSIVYLHFARGYSSYKACKFFHPLDSRLCFGDHSYNIFVFIPQWPLKQQEDVWSWFGNSLQKIYDSITPAMLSSWVMCVESILWGRDPRRNQPLVDCKYPVLSASYNYTLGS
jgi:hypothetical protein